MNQKKVSTIKTKKAELDLLEEVYDFVKGKLDESPFKVYKVVGKSSEQRRDWRTDELLWEDEEKTIPSYKDEYGYVVTPEEEYTDDDWARKAAIEDLLTKLDNLVK